MSEQNTTKKISGAILAIIFFAGLAGIVGLLLLTPPKTANEEEAHAHSEEHVHAEESTRTTEVANPYPPRKTRSAWHTVSAEFVDEIDRPEQLSEDATFVQLTGDYNQWLLGTPVKVSIPQLNVTFNSVVHKIKPNGVGKTTIYTSPVHDEHMFRSMILTYDETHTLAYVQTEQGSFELEGEGNSGWITPTSSKNEKRDYTAKDVHETLRHRHINTEYVPPRTD